MLNDQFTGFQHYTGSPVSNIPGAWYSQIVNKKQKQVTSTHVCLELDELLPLLLSFCICILLTAKVPIEIYYLLKYLLLHYII